METVVTEIAADVFRLSTLHPEYGIQFNQFLVRDEESFLMHTGLRRMFSVTLEALRSLIDPARLRWIGYSHFEPDECGALNEFLAAAPRAQPVCGFVGAQVMLKDYADREPRVLQNDETLVTGRHRLRFLATPHLPHGWDAGLFFDETQNTLFCSDLFFQPGATPALIETDIVGPARAAMRASLAGPLAHDLPYTPYTERTLERLAALKPAVLATMHGASYRGDGERAILELAGTIRELLG